jgi:hypothetical protein
MMAEAPNSFDSVDEPTQPYSRKEIDRLRRGVGVADGTVRFSVVATALDVPEVHEVDTIEEIDGEWFEVAGRRLRVALDTLDHIGLSGGAPGMITSRQFALVSGEIRRDGDAPCVPAPRFTAAHPVAGPPVAEVRTPVEVIDEDSTDYDHPGRRRGIWLVGGVLTLGLVFGIQAMWSSDEPAEEEHVEEPDDLPRESAPPVPADAKPEPQVVVDLPVVPEPVAEPAPESGKKKKKSRPDATPACVARRGDADAALRDGEWVQLEEIAKQTKCWSKASEAKALRMRALFELERFEECVELGTNDRSKEMVKWQKNCSRALQ